MKYFIGTVINMIEKVIYNLQHYHIVFMPVIDDIVVEYRLDV